MYKPHIEIDQLKTEISNVIGRGYFENVINWTKERMIAREIDPAIYLEIKNRNGYMALRKICWKIIYYFKRAFPKYEIIKVETRWQKLEGDLYNGDITVTMREKPTTVTSNIGKVN